MTLQRPSRLVALALVVAGNLALVAAGWFLVVAPQRHDAARAAQAVDATEAAIRQAASPPASSAAGAQPAIRTANLYRLAQAMPSTTDMPDLLLQLDQLARASGVTLLSIAPAATTPGAGTGYGVVPIDLTLTGDYYSLTDMLYRLRGLVGVRHGALAASGRLFSVASVDLAPTGTGKTLNAHVTVDAYVYGAGAPAAATPTTTAGTATTTAGGA